MRKGISGLLVAIALTLAAVNAHAIERRTCFERQLITKIGIGDVYLSHGVDGGDAVYFVLANGKTMFMHINFNLDTDRGRSMHDALVFAQTGRLLVSGFGYWDFPEGPGCDVVSELFIHQ